MAATISIFACDHRDNVTWNLPYMRFGGVESKCAIRCENKIGSHDVNADETPKIYWLWKNIDEFGVDYIGYCQYRRFFANVINNDRLSLSFPLVNITTQQLEHMPMIALRPV